MPGNFTLNNKFVQEHDLKHLKVHEDSKTLEVFIVMNGNHTDQLKKN